MTTATGTTATAPAVEIPTDEELERLQQLASMARRIPHGHTEEELQASRIWEADGRWWWRARLAGAPRRLWRASLTPRTALQTGAVRSAHKFLEAEDSKDHSALALCGPTGVGKTWAALGLVRELDTRFFFFHVPRLSQLLLGPSTRDAAMEAACGPLPIIVDDVGAGYLREGGLAEGLIEQILWTREGENYITIMTSNLTKAQLVTLLGDRISDRLQGPWGEIVELPGASLRRPRA